MASELKGRITDTAGAAFPPLRYERPNRQPISRKPAQTTSEGYYVFAHLVPGTYQIDVDAPGFRHATRTGITLMVGQTVAADITLASVNSSKPSP